MYTTNDCVRALQAAAGDLGVSHLRIVDYRAWRRSQEHRPGEGRIRELLGPWVEAVEAAGLMPARLAPRPPRDPQPNSVVVPLPYRPGMDPCPSCGGHVERQPGVKLLGAVPIRRGWCEGCGAHVEQAVTAEAGRADD